MSESKRECKFYKLLSIVNILKSQFDLDKSFCLIVD